MHSTRWRSKLRENPGGSGFSYALAGHKGSVSDCAVAWWKTMSAQSDKAALRHQVDEFRELLDTETFLTRDIDAPKPQRQSIVELLKSYNAIRSTGWTIPDDADGENARVNQWKWVQYREHLQEYIAERDELPCSCRVHVPPQRDGQQYVCKFCGAKHDRDTIQEAL